MEVKGPAICRQFRKDIKTKVHRCMSCDKLFPSCVKLHRIYNAANELIPCKEKTKVYVIKSSVNENINVAGGSSKERKVSSTEDSRISGSIMEDKIEVIYKRDKK